MGRGCKVLGMTDDKVGMNNNNLEGSNVQTVEIKYQHLSPMPITNALRFAGLLIGKGMTVQLVPQGNGDVVVVSGGKGALFVQV